MIRLRALLTRAAVDLGLRVETDRALTLANGKRMVAEAYFPDLGTPHGMLVFALDHPTPVVEEVIGRGGASFVATPRAEDAYDVDDFVAMFRDWGWAGDELRRPEWMDDPVG